MSHIRQLRCAAPRAALSALVIILASFLAAPLGAQGTQASPATFDLLQAARLSDSLRGVVLHQRIELARLQRLVREQTDSLRAQQRRITAIEQSSLHPSAPAFQDSVKPRQDTSAAAPRRPVNPVAPASTASASAPPQDLSVDGLLQVWAVGGDEGYRNTFRVRRAEIKITDDLGAHAKAIVLVDAAKALALSAPAAGSTQQAVTQSSRPLQDAYISATLGTLRADAGQQKLPLGLEGQQSSGALESVERALFSSDRARGGTYGDVRDLGVQLRSTLHGLLDVQLGAFDGGGENQNDVDKNIGKVVAGRAALRLPFAPRIQLGGSGLTAGKASADKPRRDRTEVELTIEHGGALLRSEAVDGWDGTIHRQGLYTLGRYAFGHGLSVHARFDAWDPDRSDESTAATVTERDYLAGASWQPLGSKARLQAAAVRKTYSSQRVPSATQILMNIQASW